MAVAKMDRPQDQMVIEQIECLVKRAKEAQVAYKNFDQQTIDRIVQAMAMAGSLRHMELAKMAVEETKMGVYEDKVIKNLFATDYIYNNIRDKKTVGVIREAQGMVEIAEPLGIIAGVTPVTNPTSTTMFKALIAVKTRNPIIFAFHPKAQKCSVAAAKTLYEAALGAGAPVGCISWIETPSVAATGALMKHGDVALILATGGAGMVQAAYSSGKPALGVGPGNVPAYIDQTADISQAVHDIILSKTFDNGTICASEQAVIVDRSIAGAVKDEFMRLGAYFLSEREIRKVEKVAIDSEHQSMSAAVVGQPAVKIAELAGVRVPAHTRVLIAPLAGVGPEYPLSREKLSPILAFYEVDGTEEGIHRCEEMTEFGGLGHSAVIHSTDEKAIREFGARVQTGRLLVNCPSSQGAIGDIYNCQTPSLTLGCGSMGQNSTTDNVGVENLINIKRQVVRRNNLQWFKVPPRIYFESNSLQYLSQLQGQRAMIVTDEVMERLGFVKRCQQYLEEAGIQVRVFNEVEPDPSVETVARGSQAMIGFQPDLIIALGGGSPIDAAKGMWLFYEAPQMRFEDLRMKFQDIRKRAFRFPQLGKKARFVAIPTTSGTGSEVTAFAVITDKEKGVKYPLADYELTPDIAILDPDLVMTVPPAVTADTGMDVLVHAIEAYVSIMASDYTDALAMKAIELVFRYLPQAYHDGSNRLAREKMHNASCIAGMAFTNAFLGINHSLAHVLGGRFHIPHGRANAILLPTVIRYNASTPTKLVPFPKYNQYRAPQRYAEIADHLGLGGTSVDEKVNNLISAIEKLKAQIQIPASIREAGVQEAEFMAAIARMADDAFADQCTVANPRLPLVSELAELYLQAYGQISTEAVV